MELKPGYKQTELGVIPQEWAVQPLKQISPKQSVGLVINPSTYYDKSGSVPLLVGSNVSENFIDESTASRITTYSNQLLTASRLAVGDLVTVRVGEPGVTAVVPPRLDGANCASMMIVRRHSSFDSHWLCSAMNSQLGRQQVENVQYGTAQKQFNISDAIDFMFAVPPLPEQRAIATALSDVDALIASLDRLIVKKCDMKQATMQELLTGKRRLPGFSGEWGVKRLGEIFNISAGGDFDPKCSSSIQDERHPYPIYSNAITDAGIYGYCSYSDHSENSITVTARGTLGSANYRNHKFTAIGRVLVLDAIEAVDGRFYSEYINSRMVFVVESTGVPQLTAPQISKYSIPVPPLHEQTAIATILSDMDTEIAALEQKRDKTRMLKQGMMQELLTGKTRLNHDSLDSKDKPSEP